MFGSLEKFSKEKFSSLTALKKRPSLGFGLTWEKKVNIQDVFGKQEKVSKAPFGTWKVLKKKNRYEKWKKIFFLRKI